MKPVRSFVFAAALAFAGAALANMPPPEPKPPEAAPATAVQATEVQPDTAAAPEAAPAPEAANANPAPPAAPAPQHPQGIEKAGPSGVIEGGWGYVYASYAVALVGLALYALSLFTRRPGAQPPSGDVP